MNMYVCILNEKVIAKIPSSTKSDANWEFKRLYPQFRNENFEIITKGRIVKS